MQQAFVLLETMNHMNFVLKEAKSRGLHIVVLNHNPVKTTGPYGVDPASIDETIHISRWDDKYAVQAALEDVNRRYTVVGTYAAFEPTLPYEAQLREMAGLPGHGVEAVRFALDKGAVRKRLYEQGLTKLRSALLSEARYWTHWHFNGEAVLKPVNGTGSALCYFVDSLESLHGAAKKVAEAAVLNPLMRDYILACGEFVLEEKAEGELLSVESLVCDGDIHFIGLSSRYVLASDPVVEMGTGFPYQHPRLLDIIAASEAFHRCLGLRHGPTHLEVMVPKHGPIELIDFNVRFSGVESLVCFNEAFEMRFESVLVDLACGLMLDLGFLTRSHQFAAEVMLLPPPGATELKELVFPPEAVFSRLMKEPGQTLSGRADQLDHVGVLVVKAPTQAALHQQVMAARRHAVVNGVALGNNPNNRVICPDFTDAEQIEKMEEAVCMQ